MLGLQLEVFVWTVNTEAVVNKIHFFAKLSPTQFKLSKGTELAFISNYATAPM